MDAQVLERAHLAVQADEDERLVEEACGDRPVRELVGPQDRVPEPPQGAVEARLSCLVEDVVGHPRTVHAARFSDTAPGMRALGLDSGCSIGAPTSRASSPREEPWPGRPVTC